MKKNQISKFFPIILPMVLSISSITPVFAQDRTVEVYIGSNIAQIDGVDYELDVEPYISNDNSMIPIRFVANALDISDDDIYFDTINKIATIVDGNKQFSLQVNNNIITIKETIDGITAVTERPMWNDAQAAIVDDRTFIPFRELSVLFDLEIEWDGNTKKVTLISRNHIPSNPDDNSSDDSDDSSNNDSNDNSNEGSSGQVSGNLVTFELAEDIKTGSSYYTRAASINNNYIYKQDSNFILVNANSTDTISVTTFDANFNKLSEQSVNFELPLFGGFYTNNENIFIVFGQNNLEENNDAEVFEVVKYDMNFNKLSSLSIDGETSNAVTPFRSGGLSIEENNGELSVHTSRLHYASSSDGLNHQSQITFIIDSDTMELKNKGGEFQTNHVSHSFNQFVTYDDTSHILVDHGDAYPRSIVLHKGTTDNYTEVNLMEIPGEIGANMTGVTVGGVEVSSTNYLVPINKVDFDKVESFNSQSLVGLEKDERDVVLLTCDKNLENVNAITLQKYVDTDKTSSTPKIIEINNNSFIVIWEEQSLDKTPLSVKYIIVNATGNPTTGIQTISNATLSSVQPLYDNSTLVWYVNNNAYKLRIDASGSDNSEDSTESTTGDASGENSTEDSSETTTGDTSSEDSTESTTDDASGENSTEDSSDDSTNNESSIDVDEFENEVISLVNIERVAVGAEPLELYEPAMELARAKSQDMATNNYFSHADPDGNYMYKELLSTIDSNGNIVDTIGENIAAGQSTPQSVVSSWMNSDSHKENILNTGFNKIGVGVAEGGDDSDWNFYWTQVFVSTTDSRAFEEEVIRLVNIERAEVGAEPLELHEPAMELARAKSQDMDTNNYLAHEDSDGNFMSEDLKQYSSIVAENIEDGQETPEDVVKAWIATEVYKENILNPDHKYIGVGFVNYKWTQMFMGSLDQA